jgi:hypothetical protein
VLPVVVVREAATRRRFGMFTALRASTTSWRIPRTFGISEFSPTKKPP